MVVLDDVGRIVRFNRACERTIGYDEQPRGAVTGFYIDKDWVWHGFVRK